jgi:putative FmdB family regulatory protein
MPRYDFKCPRCGVERHDVVVSFAELEHTDTTAPCERCGAKLERMPGRFSFVIKGYNATNGYSS